MADKKNVFRFIEEQPSGYIDDMAEAVKEQLTHCKDPYQAFYQTLRRGKIGKTTLGTSSRKLIVDAINVLESTEYKYQDFDWSPIK